MIGTLRQSLLTVLLAAALQAQSRPQTESFDKLSARARVALEAEHVPEAIQLYSRATRMRPSWSEGWWHLGTLHFDSGNFKDAREAFTHFVALEKAQPGPGFAMLGLCQFHLNLYSKALSALERGIKLGLGPSFSFNRTVLYHAGILLTSRGESELAIVRLTRAANFIAASRPDAPRDSVFADKDLLDALGIATLRLGKLPSDVPAAQAPLIRQAGRAQALVALQDRVAAESEYKQLLSLYPSEPGVHYAYGVFLLKEHPPQAIDEFRRELEVSPSHDAARIQLALALLGTADYEQGLKYAQEAVALAPENFVAHVACGRLYLALDKTDKAVEELRLAVRLAPGSPDAHFALSRALSQAGHTAEAARERAEFDRLKALSETTNH